ncbi:hypothetical protein [Dactylosporangium sp. CA-233914]|uniref:hypothetical protein n=1 Tax=Dactylosporangium sp. CA-233914 TaxID=3239934 RepID=UPI003D92071A
MREFSSYRGQRHFPDSYWSASMNSHVGFGSWLECDHAILPDFDPQVVAFASQPSGCTGGMLRLVRHVRMHRIPSPR